jgi:hypothetical protein
MNAKTNEWETTRIKNVKRLALWTGSWVLTMALAAFGPKFIWDYNATFSVLAISLNTLMGIGMILMNRKYINELDELHKKVNMDAMAISLGVGVVGGLSYSMLDVVNVVSFDAEISHVLMLISITYIIAIVVGNLRYK